ncbi:MAG: hypothetical protein V9G12_16355 [Microthrixaceae bacterium]
MPMPVAVAMLRNDETKLPDWLATPIEPAGGYGATICAHRPTGVDTTPWPLGPASRMPSSSHRATSSASATRPSLARLAVAGRGEERRRDALAGAGAQQVGVGRRRGAHEDEVGLAVGQVVDARDVSMPRTGAPSRLVANTLPS